MAKCNLGKVKKETMRGEFSAVVRVLSAWSELDWFARFKA